MPKTSTAPNSALKSSTQLAVAACSMALGAGGNVIQLTPAGAFRALDGRPKTKTGVPLPDWRIDAALAQQIVDQVSKRVTPLVIDYDHQTLRAAQNGQPAPAAGWFHNVQWREGEGLFATDVTWNETASTMIAANEYKFISPVIAYGADGAVTGLLMAAITNNPAIDAMDEVMLAAASYQYAALTATTPPTTEPQMEALLEQLRWMLNLPVASTAEDILASLTKLGDMIKEGQGGTAAAGVDLVAMFAELRTKVASLSATTAPDLSQFVPIDTVAELHKQIATLSGTVVTDNLDKVITDAKNAGKLLPALEGWARKLGTQNIAALTSYLETAPAIAALSGMQSDKTDLSNAGGGTAALTAEQSKMCVALGVSEEDFLATLKS